MGGGGGGGGGSEGREIMKMGVCALNLTYAVIGIQWSLEPETSLLGARPPNHKATADPSAHGASTYVF